MRWHCLVWKTATIAEHHGRDQGSHTGRDMHHDATSKIHYTQFAKPATAPHPMANWGIDKNQPSRAEQNHSRKAHPLSKATHDQRRGDDGKGHLKQRKDALGDCAQRGILTDLRK